MVPTILYIVLPFSQAKIARMTYDPEEAIGILQDGLKPGRPGRFPQADALVRHLS